MNLATELLSKIKSYGVGRRGLDDGLFDFDDKPPPRLGVYDLDDENLCHEVIKTSCNIPGCKFTAETLIEFEEHYNSSHRYSCAQCKKMLPSPHFLDLHLQESHDSFFATMAERKPSYCCYIEECKEKFMTPALRHDHCVNVHKLPKDFRFEQKIKKNAIKDSFVKNKTASKQDTKVTFFHNNQKTFPKYTGRKFTKNNENQTKKVEDMEIAFDELKASLPE